MQKIKIVWDSEASEVFSLHIKYIRLDSPKNADNVKKDIIEAIKSLLVYPEKYAPDKYKSNNNRSEYRAFEKHHLRISYRFHNNEIRIIKIRHTKQNPQPY